MDLKVKWKRGVIYIIIFSIFAGIFCNIPLVHDSWAGQVYNKSGNFIAWVVSRFSGYFFLNGRIIAQIFVGFFERNELMLDISNAALMTSLVYLIQKNAKAKINVISAAMVMLLILLVSSNIRVEVYFYATMIYLVPVILFFIFLWYTKLYQEKTWGTDKSRFLILCVLGILNSGWIEHSGFSFVFIIGICWLKDIIKYKKINIRFTVFELINGITFLIMILSPGLRQQRQLKTESESIVKIAGVNSAKIMQAIIFDHKLLMLILIVTCILVIRKKMKKGLLSFAYQCIMGIYAILFVVNLVSANVGITIPKLIEMNCLQENIFGIVYVVLGIVLLMLLLVALFYENEREKLCFVYWVGVFSLLPIIVTPNFGYRICFFSLMLLIYLISHLFFSLEIKGKKVQYVVNALIVIALLIQVDMYSVLVANISEIQREREARIELVRDKQRLGEWNYEKTLILPTFSQEQLYTGASPEPFYDYVHYQAFLDFYKLDPKTLLLFSDDDNYELQININDEIQFEIFSKYEEEPYSYDYYIMKNGQVVWNSGQIQEKRITAVSPSESGNYYFKCIIIDEQGNTREVYSAKIFSEN